jgi:hypothetical protein
MLAPLRGKHANRRPARLSPRPRVSRNSTTRRVATRLPARLALPTQAWHTATKPIVPGFLWAKARLACRERGWFKLALR